VVVTPDPGTEPVADTEAPAALAAASPLPGIVVQPERPAAPSSGTTEAIYLASIDPVTRASDAVALPAVVTFARGAVPAILPPTPPMTVAETPAADVNVTLGPPPVAPPPRSATPPTGPEAGTLPEPTDLARSLPDRRPLARPAGLAERNERAIFAGRTRAEMAALRPRGRPESAQALAVAAAPAPPSDQAVARSPAPRDRPEDFASRIATANAIAAALAAAPPEPPPPAPAPEPAPAPQVAAAAPPPAAAQPPAAAPSRTAAAPRAAAPEPADEYDDGEPDVAAAAPNIPTSASVARQATIRNAMRLSEINLIGVYGTERDRRALVRLPSGRFVKVEVGDRLDGGRIAAIGRDELRYVKGGRNVTLQVPSG
jgi:hypothetical protein